MSDLTDPTAFSAASFLRSSWVRAAAGVERHLTVAEKGLRWLRLVEVKELQQIIQRMVEEEDGGRGGEVQACSRESRE